MKHWQESRQVYEWLATLEVEQRPAALATVVAVQGSAYRREGAKLAVAAGGECVGNVSGGCLEGDVREVALQVIASGRREIREYCSSVDEIPAWDLGVGCEGSVRVLIEPAPPSARIEHSLLGAVVPFVTGTPLDGTDAGRLIITAAGSDGTLGEEALQMAVVAEARTMLRDRAAPVIRSVSGMDIFFDVYIPPPQLLIFGAGNDARPLARFAAEAGFRVTVLDHRPALLAADRFPAAVSPIDCAPAALASQIVTDADTFAVVMTHSFADDFGYLSALAATPARYIGLLGPRQRGERLIERAGLIGYHDRIYTPVGLDVGTDGAEQVALAIVAELLAVHGGRDPMSLRSRVHPIHAVVTPL